MTGRWLFSIPYLWFRKEIFSKCLNMQGYQMLSDFQAEKGRQQRSILKWNLV
jgi:hypothetical protein